MAFTNDYIMRQIEQMANGLGAILFEREPDKIDTLDRYGNVTPEGLLWLRLMKMIAEGRINEAENELFEAIDGDEACLFPPVILRFYAELAALGAEKLVSCGFSEREAGEGLRDALKQYEGRSI